MSKSQIITYSIMGVVSVIVIIMLFTIIRNIGNKDVYTHDEVIKAKDQTISAIVDGRKKDSVLIAEKDRSILHLLEIDSIKNRTYIQNQNVYTKINEKVRSIPAYVNRIGGNDDSLRAVYKSAAR